MYQRGLWAVLWMWLWVSVSVAAGATSGCGPPEEPKTPADMQRACDAERLRSCIGLAYDYATGRDVQQDPARAATLYEKACRGGLVVGCVNLGVAFALGSGVPQDQATAARLFRDACERGPAGEESVPVACVNLGVVIDEGLAQPTSGETPTALFSRACQTGFPPGCRYAGLSVVARDSPRGAAFLDRACAGGDAPACKLVEKLRRGEPIEFDETILFAKVNYHY